MGSASNLSWSTQCSLGIQDKSHRHSITRWSMIWPNYQWMNHLGTFAAYTRNLVPQPSLGWSPRLVCWMLSSLSVTKSTQESRRAPRYWAGFSKSILISNCSLRDTQSNLRIKLLLTSYWKPLANTQSQHSLWTLPTPTWIVTIATLSTTCYMGAIDALCKNGWFEK